jgi:hypothetical protein
MIARLRGTPVARTADGLVLDVAGVGYLVRATDRAYQKAKEGREVTLDTYLHVREDVLQLFGFAEPAERELFEKLLSVTGVGAANRAQIEKIFFRAMTQLMPNNANVVTAAAAVVQAAVDLYGPGAAATQAVTQAMTAVGLR